MRKTEKEKKFLTISETAKIINRKEITVRLLMTKGILIAAKPEILLRDVDGKIYESNVEHSKAMVTRESADNYNQQVKLNGGIYSAGDRGQKVKVSSMVEGDTSATVEIETFKNMITLTKEMKMSPRTVKKYIDTKELFHRDGKTYMFHSCD